MTDLSKAGWFCAGVLALGLWSGTASAQVLFYDNFQQFASGTILTTTNYTPASGPVGASVVISNQNGTPTTLATNFLNQTWAFFDDSAVGGKSQYKGYLSSLQTGQVLQVSWTQWIQATNGGAGGFFFSVPTSDPVANYNPPVGFLDTGAIVALTNGTAPVLTIGNWAALAGTVMTNRLVLDYSNRTSTYWLNGVKLSTLPLGPYFTNVVGTIYFNGNERSGSLGNRFAIGNVAVQAPVSSGPARYSFGDEIQDGDMAGITNNQGVLQYTDPVVTDFDDDAYLFLAGSATNYITTTNAWSVSLAVNIAAQSLTATSNDSPHVSMGLALAYFGPDTYFLQFEIGQVNQGGANGFYGTKADFTLLEDGILQGDVLWQFGGGTRSPGTPATEPIAGVSGVLTLSYNPSNQFVASYFDGVFSGGTSIAGWGVNPPLSLAVFGASGQGVAVSNGTAVASNFFVAPFPNPRVPFTAGPASGALPLPVQFSSPAADSLGNAITSWLWYFGDGATSTNQNPGHTYTNAGVFSPSLAAFDTLGVALNGSGPQISVLSSPVILSSGPTFGVLSNRFGFTVSWASNATLVVQASTNPAVHGSWIPVSTNGLTNGSFYFSDPQWKSFPRRYYRVSAP